MQFKLSALTALLAASASVYADSISGSKVTNILDTLTKGARDLNSSLQSTQDASSTGQTILSGEQKAMAEKQDALLSLAAEGDRRVAPKDQSAVCQSLLTSTARCSTSRLNKSFSSLSLRRGRLSSFPSELHPLRPHWAPTRK
ncbi:hypothetical protein AFLA70_95g003130 [Aspergillus flavus AF70]|nr:hypothetical protein AFLA70_95g003130 [Aspergillus flavus AF70]